MGVKTRPQEQVEAGGCADVMRFAGRYRRARKETSDALATRFCPYSLFTFQTGEQTMIARFVSLAILAAASAAFTAPAGAVPVRVDIGIGPPPPRVEVV